MNMMFGSLTTDGLEESKDTLGGFQPLDTDIYSGSIKIAYAIQSPGGARGVVVIGDWGGREYRETVYVTTRDGKNYTMAKDKSGKPTDKKRPLPGFTTIDDLCLAATGYPLSEQKTEEKVVNVYDPAEGKELPKAVPVLVDLVGKDVSLGIIRILENKSEKQGDEYVDIADTREVNQIDKVFHTESRRTIAEIRQGAETAVFWDSWLDKNKGNTRDKRTIKDGEQNGASGRPGASKSPPQAGGNSGGAPRRSLFGS